MHGQYLQRRNAVNILAGSALWRTLRIRELVVLNVARYWRADFEWYAHEGLARSAGLPDSVIEVIKAGTRPEFTDSTDAVVYAC